MKQLFILLMLACTINVVASTNSPVKLGYTNTQLITPPAVVRSVAFNNNLAISKNDADKCSRFKGMMIGGAVALGVGASLFSGGVTMIVIGGRGIDEGNDNFNNVGLVVGGAIMVVWGTVGTIAGIPLLAIGASKTSKYCKSRSQSALHLIKRGNTAGLALRF
ncbi:MAG: hypothetical protein KIS94_10015 [Chitinophagales bacterium]|nr:hypothetical protein [Chitinophagales bacterium]